MARAEVARLLCRRRVVPRFAGQHAIVCSTRGVQERCRVSEAAERMILIGGSRW